MADQTIKPVSPASRTSDVLKKKKTVDKNIPPSKPDQSKDESGGNKGIIDTYA